MVRSIIFIVITSIMLVIITILIVLLKNIYDWHETNTWLFPLGTFLSCQSYIFFSRTINIIIIINIIEVMTIKMILIIIILPCDYSHKY